MIYLFGFIIGASFLVILFKFFPKFKTNNFQIIVFNYITASILGLMSTPLPVFSKTDFGAPWVLVSMGSGIVFISTYNLIAFSVNRVGINTVTIAQKMSLIIPVMFAWFVLKEPIKGFGVLGMVFSLFAIALVSYKPNNLERKRIKYILPLFILLGSGCVDTLIKVGQHYFIGNIHETLYISFVYGGAALIGISIMLGKILFGKFRLNVNSIFAGIILGFVNYLSMICLVRLLAIKSYTTNFSFSMVNTGIIIFSALFAYFVFKEKLNKINYIGLGLGILSVLLFSLI